MAKDLEKEYEEYLKSQYEEYKAGNSPTSETPTEVTIPGEHSYAKIKPNASTETLQDVLTTAPQGVTTWSDEAMAGLGAVAQKPFSDKPFADLYEENVGTIRQNIANARERSPVATTLGEIGTGIGTSFIPGLGAGKLTGAGGMIGRGAFEGLGTAEDKASMEGVTQAGIGAGLGAGGAILGGAVKKLTSANPSEIRANVLGARTSEFKEIGIKEREKIAEKLKNMGLFSSTKVEFDPKSMKFVTQGKSLENMEKPARDKLAERLDSAMDKIQVEKMKILGKHANDIVDLGAIEEALDDVAKHYSVDATGRGRRLTAATAIKDEIMEDIAADMGDGPATLDLIEAAKKRIGKDVGNYGKNPQLQKTPDEAQIYQGMYSAINKKLRKLIGNNKYADFNDAQQEMMTAHIDLLKATAAEKASTASAGWGGWMNKGLNTVLGSPEAGLGMANMAEGVQKASPLLPPVRAGISELPYAAARQLDVSIPQPQLEVGPSFEEVQQSPEGYNFNSAVPAFRKPQSVGYGENPMVYANMRLPRTSEEWIRNKDLVLKKMAVSDLPVEIMDATREALNSSQGDVESIMRTVALTYPHIMAKSKYNMVNGKIIDPAERAKAAQDTSMREDIGSIQKAKIIGELNKPQGRYLGD